MSKEQKGFVVYGDIQDVINELEDEQVAQLFRGMVDYFVDGKDPKFSGVLKFVFIPIKQQMDRNASKYEKKCEKMRENANKRWNSMQKDAIAYNGIQLNANDANTNTDTDTKTNTDTDTNTNIDTDTTTTTNTDTNTNVGGGSGDFDGDDFNLWKKMDSKDVDAIYNAYPNSGGFLIEEVVAEVKAKRTKVKSPVPYILGYAKKVGWDDNEDHFADPWRA